MRTQQHKGVYIARKERKKVELK